jgi:hypothetical protein
MPGIEGADRPYDPVNLLLPECRVYWDAQHIRSSSLGLGAPNVSESQPTVQGTFVDR